MVPPTRRRGIDLDQPAGPVGQGPDFAGRLHGGQRNVKLHYRAVRNFAVR